MNDLDRAILEERVLRSELKSTVNTSMVAVAILVSVAGVMESTWTALGAFAGYVAIYWYFVRPVDRAHREAVAEIEQIRASQDYLGGP